MHWRGDAEVRRSVLALIVTDSDHRIRSWSAGAERLLGYTAAEVVGKPQRILVPEDLYESDEQDLRRRVAGGEEVLFHASERLAKDGRRIPVEVCRTAILDPEGNPAGFGTILLDPSERRAFHDRLVQEERLATLAKVVGKVFHELRTPLGVLVLQTEILTEEIEELIVLAGERADAKVVSRLRETLGFFTREIDRIESLAEDYLLMIRPIRPHRTDLPLGEFLGAVQEEIRSKCTRPNSRVEIRCDRPETTVSLDPLQILRVFHNLAANSIEAIPDDLPPRLTLDVAVEEREVRFRLRDNGPGLPPGFEDGGAFAMFATTKRTGSGLGLHLVQEIVAAHGGAVSLANHPGGGAEALLVLPRTEPACDA